MRRSIALPTALLLCACASQHGDSTIAAQDRSDLAARAAEALRRYPVASVDALSQSWTFRGPQNLSGITYCLLTDPANPSLYFSGSAEGLWRSDDAGANWYAVSDLDGLQVMSLARDSHQHDVIYAATGFEGKGAGGVYKSSDGGLNWRKLSLPVSPTTRSVAVSPDDSKIVIAGTSSGVFRSTDAGENWTPVIAAGVNAMVVFGPNDGSRVIAGFRDEGANGGPAHVMVSSDGGATFREASGIADPSAYSVVVAVAPSMPQRVYAASVGLSVTETLWRSDDGGQSFRKMTGFPNIMGYHIRNSLFVLPTNPDTVIFAGIKASISTTGGSGFVDLSTTRTASGEWPHTDYLFVVGDPASAKRLFACTDGGVFATDDFLTGIWRPLARGHSSTQYYSIDVSARGRMVGGMQDTGVSITEPGTLDTKHLHDADTTAVIFDPKDDSRCFYVEFGRIRSCDGRDLGDVSLRSSRWGNPVAVSPADPTRVFVASLNVVRLDQIQDLNNITSTTIRQSDGQHFWAMGADPLNANILWIGSDEGAIYQTTGATSSMPAWATVFTSTPELSAALPTTIYFDRHDSRRVYVAADRGILETSDGGATWRSIFGPARVERIVEHPLKHGWLYAGTQVGLFISDDEGEHWSAASGPVVPARVDIRDLVFQPGTTTLYAATYGRGVWSLDIPVSTARRRAVRR
ncbi:MAG TPA: hypothetical protein VLV78_14115 [Thermoanaerobaculia bacterium]|nr:hypothetical protein [Thermoanaerobaculia bacterium]